MIAILKNNLHRVERQTVVLLIVFTAAATAAAVFASTGMKQTWRIAVVSNAPVTFSAEQVYVTQMEMAPPRSDLISGKYDAILTGSADGGYTVDSIKSEENVQTLKNVLNGAQETGYSFSDRGTGTNVLGFLTVFLLLMGTTCMGMFADDKAYGQLERITASPVKPGTCLMAYCLFDFSFLFLPTATIVTLVKIIGGVDLGYNFLQLAFLLAVICLLSTIFALLLFAFLPNKDDSAKMTGNTVIILTSILAGGFYDFDRGNHMMGIAVAILPQKAFLSLADGIERGQALGSCLPSLVYLLGLIVLFYCAAARHIKRLYGSRR